MTGYIKESIYKLQKVLLIKDFFFKWLTKKRATLGSTELSVVMDRLTQQMGFPYYTGDNMQY